MDIAKKVQIVKKIIYRNRIGLNCNQVIEKKRVNLEFWDAKNIGDQLSPVIFDYMINKNGIDSQKEVKKTKHLLALGSLIAIGEFDATVWGTGLLTSASIGSIYKKRLFRKMDIRAVRGPITRSALISAGYSVPDIYGDPGCLMPLIYDNKVEKKYDASIVLHLNENSKNFMNFGGLHYISLATKDYKYFIDEIRASKKIISSSLHGIILAEAYGVPAIFLNTKGAVDDMLIKYLDWYYSTDRYEVKIAYCIEQALSMEPMQTPDLRTMQENLINSFPVDLWE